MPAQVQILFTASILKNKNNKLKLNIIDGSLLHSCDGRVVKALDSKSNGQCPHGFQSSSPIAVALMVLLFWVWNPMGNARKISNLVQSVYIWKIKYLTQTLYDEEVQPLGHRSTMNLFVLEILRLIFYRSKVKAVTRIWTNGRTAHWILSLTPWPHSQRNYGSMDLVNCFYFWKMKYGTTMHIGLLLRWPSD